MDSTVIFSVIFPGNLPFFESFLKSLANQSEKRFSLALAVDNVPDIQEHIKEYQKHFPIKYLGVSGSIASVRRQGIEWLLSMPIEKVIFADTDDLLSADRVKVCKKLLDNHPVIVSDLYPFANETDFPEKGFWQVRMQDMELFSFESILNYNFVGLGNSAVRKEIISTVEIPDSIKVVDWFLFSQWLRKTNARGVFTHEGPMMYRQHEANMSGVKKLTVQRLFNIIEVKKIHYENSDDVLFSKQLKRLYALEKELKNDSDYLNAAIENLNRKPVNFYWWEETEYIL